VDTILREELDIADGLADHVSMCSILVAAPAHIWSRRSNKFAATLKQRAATRFSPLTLRRPPWNVVFGFEILPAPFVVSHLQLGLLLQQMGAPLNERKKRRVGVYLTNALTGWEPPKGPKQKFLFKEFEEERDAADRVKREAKIIVILGNPPYKRVCRRSVR